jgi:heme A synthase
MENIPAWVKYVAKALLTALAVVITFLTTILTGNQTLADVTFVQWLVCIGLVLSAFGIVYRVPNGPDPRS